MRYRPLKWLKIVAAVASFGCVACALLGIWTGVGQWGATAGVLGLVASITAMHPDY